MNFPVFYLAQLRHAYEQLIRGEVRNQHAFARGLIGPAIEAFEKYQVSRASVSANSGIAGSMSPAPKDSLSVDQQVKTEQKMHSGGVSPTAGERGPCLVPAWLPIASAPKDGTPFFAYFPDWRVSDFANWKQYVEFVGEGNPATYWHPPLPSPPIEDVKGVRRDD